MEMIPVHSSNIHSIGYDTINEDLIIIFHSGYTYKFLNVPEYKYESLMIATSKGSYFSDNIKNKYPTQRLR